MNAVKTGAENKGRARTARQVSGGKAPRVLQATRGRSRSGEGCGPVERDRAQLTVAATWRNRNKWGGISGWAGVLASGLAFLTIREAGGNAQIADAPGQSGEPANRAEAVIRSLLTSPNDVGKAIWLRVADSKWPPRRPATLKVSTGCTN
jgi:hypothetical protein